MPSAALNARNLAFLAYLEPQTKKKDEIGFVWGEWKGEQCLIDRLRAF